jgi:hypothetical protein
LKKGVHYDVDEKAQTVLLTDQGVKDCERALGKGLFDLVDPWASYITNGLKAKELLIKDRDYIVRGAYSASDGKNDLTTDKRGQQAKISPLWTAFRGEFWMVESFPMAFSRASRSGWL